MAKRKGLYVKISGKDAVKKLPSKLEKVKILFAQSEILKILKFLAASCEESSIPK
jgi:hypothetical protein